VFRILDYFNKFVSQMAQFNGKSELFRGWERVMGAGRPIRDFTPEMGEKSNGCYVNFLLEQHQDGQSAVQAAR
jgi:hypothetical protein